MRENAVSRWLFSFSAKGLQGFVMEGGKLRDMVGATSLIDEFCQEEFLKKQAVACGCGNEKGDLEIVQAAAGAAKILFKNRDAAERMARLWPVFCSAWAPGMDVVQDLREVSEGCWMEALKASAEAMEMDRKFPGRPEMTATPVMELAPRTGRPAMDESHEGLIDESSVRKREIRGAKNPVILTRCGLEDVRIPDDFESIAGGEGGDMAIVHADGNGLGQLFLNLVNATTAEMDEQEVRTCFKDFSDLIAKKTASAVQEAIDGVWPEKERTAEDGQTTLIAPILPIVLAGDDLTLVCRADLAFRFTELFLRDWEVKMSAGLRDINGPEALKKVLTEWQPSAGAGIVFCKPSYPFARAYELVENLASFAKGEAKIKNPAAPGATLSFFGISGSSASESVDDLREREWLGDGVSFEAGPYWLTREGDGKSLEDLRILASATRKLSSGKARTLLTHLREDFSRVKPLLDRLKVTEKKNFSEILESEVLLTEKNPWLDALTLYGVEIPKKVTTNKDE